MIEKITLRWQMIKAYSNLINQYYDGIPLKEDINLTFLYSCVRGMLQDGKITYWQKVSCESLLRRMRSL